MSLSGNRVDETSLGEVAPVRMQVLSQNLNLITVSDQQWQCTALVNFTILIR